MENLTRQELKDLIKEAVTEVMEDQSSKLSNTDILNSVDAAKFLGLSKGMLYKLTMEKKIPFSKPTGKIMYFKKSDLIAFQTSKMNK